MRRHRRHGHGEGGHGPSEHGHRGGVRRLLAHGDLRFLLLHLIAESPRHGYEIIKAIEDSVSGAYSPSPGVVYPTLTMLEDLGWVRSSETEGGRKRYEATDEGRAALDANRAIVTAIQARLEEVRGSHRRDVDPRIVKAMERLKRSLLLRSALRPATEEEVDAIAKAISHAAETVEKL
jgi:DNA-binding PadR family transcriptional regulator